MSSPLPEENKNTPKPYILTPEIQKKNRIIGVVMAVLAMATIIYVIWKLSFEPQTMWSLTENVSPENSFPDLYHIVSGDMALYSVIGGGAFMVLWMGTYRIINGRPGTWHKFVAFLIGFAIMIGHSLYINSVREDVYKELASIQHTWAEDRYGITYDEITILETEGRKGTTNKNQDKVVKDGEIIAKVCKPDRETILFCEPDSDYELFVYSSSY